MEWLSVSEAAAKLALSEPQVRRLVRSGALVSERVGKSWLVSAAAVRERQQRNHPAGRPVSAAMAWSFLWVLEGPAGRAVAAEDDRRQRYRLRRMLDHAPAPEDWSFWLRRRAEPRRYWVHPAVLPKIEQDRRLRPSGVGSASAPVRCWYVDEGDVVAVAREHRAKPDPAGQVVLMAIPDNVPVELRPPAGGPVPNAVALVDLLDSVDAREKHEGAVRLSALLVEARQSS